MDRLSSLLAHFALTARVFHTGALCGWAEFDEAEGVGHVHILRSGRLRATRPGQPDVDVTQPALLLYPRPLRHRILVGSGESADVLCASVDFGAAAGNPVLQGLPDLLVVGMDSAPVLEPALHLLFTEAFENRCGRQAALDRLTEYLMIQVLRHAIAHRLVAVGTLAGLADARLARAITAMHDRPGESWSLQLLAQTAGMSRARFAVAFRRTVGVTPMDYLTNWRLALAQGMLRRGLSLKKVSHDVGYASTTAFARVFSQRVGHPPSRWAGIAARVAPDGRQDRPQAT